MEFLSGITLPLLLCLLIGCKVHCVISGIPFYADGQHEVIYDSGDRYNGEWKDGMKHGEGSYEFVDGNKYVGEWENDQITGKGIFTFSNGSICRGIFSNGTTRYLRANDPVSWTPRHFPGL